MDVRELIENLLDYDMEARVNVYISTKEEDHVIDIKGIDTDFHNDVEIVIELADEVIVDADELERLQELE